MAIFIDLSLVLFETYIENSEYASNKGKTKVEGKTGTNWIKLYHKYRKPSMINIEGFFYDLQYNSSYGYRAISKWGILSSR